MKDFEASADFLFVTMPSGDMITYTTAPPDPKSIKRKGLLLIKARQESNDEDGGDFFPTGIEKEVIFMEVTGKLLSNLYNSCHVSKTFAIKLRNGDSRILDLAAQTGLRI